MKTSVKISLVVAIVVVVGAVFVMNKSSHNKDVAKDNSATSKVANTPVMPKANGESTKSAEAVVKKELPSNPYLNAESMASLPASMKEFLLLDMKSIRSSAETKDFYEILRSEAAITDAQKLLMKVNPSNIAESEREHLTATRFLGRALGDLNNKSNKALNEAVKKIILTDNISGSDSLKVKMIYAGDKAELVQTMIAFNPNIHKELLGRTKNANIKKIVENAYTYNEEMRAKN